MHDFFSPGDRVKGVDFAAGEVVRVGERFIWVRRDGEVAAKASLPKDLTRILT